MMASPASIFTSCSDCPTVRRVAAICWPAPCGPRSKWCSPKCRQSCGGKRERISESPLSISARTNVPGRAGQIRCRIRADRFGTSVRGAGCRPTRGGAAANDAYRRTADGRCSALWTRADHEAFIGELGDLPPEILVVSKLHLRIVDLLEIGVR